jgi:hypothetical protein
MTTPQLATKYLFTITAHIGSGDNRHRSRRPPHADRVVIDVHQVP